MLLKPPPGGSGGRVACSAFAFLLAAIFRPADPESGLPVSGFFRGIFLLSLGEPPLGRAPANEKLPIMLSLGTLIKTTFFFPTSPALESRLGGV